MEDQNVVNRGFLFSGGRGEGRKRVKVMERVGREVRKEE